MSATWEGIARAAEKNVEKIQRAKVVTLAEAAAQGVEPPPLFIGLIENQELMWQSFANEIRRMGQA